MRIWSLKGLGFCTFPPKKALYLKPETVNFLSFSRLSDTISGFAVNSRTALPGFYLRGPIPNKSTRVFPPPPLLQLELPPIFGFLRSPRSPHRVRGPLSAGTLWWRPLASPAYFPFFPLVRTLLPACVLSPVRTSRDSRKLPLPPASLRFDFAASPAPRPLTLWSVTGILH